MELEPVSIEIVNWGMTYKFLWCFIETYLYYYIDEDPVGTIFGNVLSFEQVG